MDMTMKKRLFRLAALLAFCQMMALAQSGEPVSDILFREGQGIPQDQQIINEILPLVIIYVDFHDSRLANGQPPQDTLQLQQVNINAVGSFGWIKDESVFPPVYRKKIRKYVYEDYWDQWFSAGEWMGTRHPDFGSHEGFVWPGYPPTNEPPWTYRLHLYGGFRDYWNEVSYGNVQILPFPTKSGAVDKYHTGVVNNIDVIGGRKYIHWINLPLDKSYYDENINAEIIQLQNDLSATLAALHNLPPENPDHIEFDFANYTGKYAIIGAGTRFGGYAWYGGPNQVMPEKWSPQSYVPLLAAHEADCKDSVKPMAEEPRGGLKMPFLEWALLDSNQRPADYESAALTD